MGIQSAAHFARPTIKTKYQRLLKSTTEEIKKLKEKWKRKKLKTEERKVAKEIASVETKLATALNSVVDC
jgi:hypothetical protein